MLKTHPGAASASAGVVFGAILFLLGGAQLDALGFVLIALLGLTFAAAMYWVGRANKPQ